MQEPVENARSKKLKMESFTVEERQKLISAFAWLLEEDKKQNPSLYKIKSSL